MIAPIHPEQPEQPSVSAAGGKQGSAPSGEGALFVDPAKYHDDCRLVIKAAKRRWPVGKLCRRRAVARLERIIEENPDDELAVNAIRAVGYLDSLNIKREHGPPQGGGSNTVNILNVSIETLLNAPGYVEYLESRDDCDAGTVCPNGDAGEVLPTPPHPGNLNGHSGNHHGKN